MSYILLIILGVAPGLIWLFFFLRKDSDHPEPRIMLSRSFFLGMMITLPAAFIELLLNRALGPVQLNIVIKTLISFFLAVAFVEEFLKYLIMRGFVMKTGYFDEPIDAMIYPIVISLGFATLENILAVFTMPDNYMALTLVIWRFVSATLIHALSASVWGYFIALHCFFKKPRYFVAVGLFLGTLIHGTYNLIVSTDNQFVFGFLFPILVLPVSFLVAMEFKRLHYSNSKE